MECRGDGLADLCVGRVRRQAERRQGERAGVAEARWHPSLLDQAAERGLDAAADRLAPRAPRQPSRHVIPIECFYRPNSASWINRSIFRYSRGRVE